MKQISKSTSTLLFIFLTGVLVVVAFISYNRILQYSKSVDSVLHTHMVKSEIVEVLSNLTDAENSQRGFLLTNDSVYIQLFAMAADRNKLVFAKLESLTSDNEEQKMKLKKLKKLVNERFVLLDNNLGILKDFRSLFRDSALLIGKSKMDEVRNQVALMLLQEDRLLAERTHVKDRTASITPIVLLVLSLFSILVVTLFFFRLQKETSARISIAESNLLLEEAKRQMEASEFQFRTFADSIQNLAWIADGEGLISWYNKRWLDYTGLTLEEMRGWGWQKVHHPDHVERIVELSKQLWKKNQAFELTFPLRRHDGVYRWFLTRGFPIKNPLGIIDRWIGTNTDITEQKSSTEELEKKVSERTKELQIQNETFGLAENIAKFGSYTWHITTGVLEYSDNLFRLFDCEPQEFVPSLEKFLSFIHPDDLQQVINNGHLTRQTGELVEMPYRIISKTGNTKYFRSNGHFSGEGLHRLLIGTVQDISSDVASSIILKSKNLELANMNAELASFNYVASHDLQEPLRKIQGFSKRIMDKDGEKLSDTTKDYFNRIQAAAKRMQNLIESLINFSRTNIEEIKFEKTDLNLTLTEVKSVLNDLLIKKNAVIDAQALPKLNAVPLQMHQMFLNIIGNSLKYSKPDVALLINITAEKVSIDGSGENIELNGTFWKIAFTDNGIGFEQEYETRIFEVFQRLHGRTEYEGTGIGLAICKKIAQAHNGAISATAELGVGATFTVYLQADNKS